MKKTLNILSIILIGLILNSILLYSQSEEELNLEELNFDDLDSLYDEIDETDFKVDFYYSSGWFARPNKHFGGISFNYTTGWMLNDARNIMPQDAVPVLNGFNSKNPLTSKERRVYKPNSNSRYNNYPTRTMFKTGFELMYGYALPLILNLGINYSYQRSLLYSIDNTKQFIDNSGKLRNIKEANIIDVRERNFEISLGAYIPVYGAFGKMDETSIFTYNYLYLGYRRALPFYSRADQYVQLANNKKSLRYENGQDTLRLLSNYRFQNTTNERDYLELAIGWTGGGTRSGATFELGYLYPLTDIIKGTPWRQHQITLSIKLMVTDMFK